MKYALVPGTESYRINGQVEPLHRIRAMADIPQHGVASGDLGGYVTLLSSLNQHDDAWVGGNAALLPGCRMQGSALLTGDALALGDSIIKDNAHVGGTAYIASGAKICDNADIRGHVRVTNATVGGNTLIHLPRQPDWVYFDIDPLTTIPIDAHIKSHSDYIICRMPSLCLEDPRATVVICRQRNNRLVLSYKTAGRAVVYEVDKFIQFYQQKQWLALSALTQTTPVNFDNTGDSRRYLDILFETFTSGLLLLIPEVKASNE